LRSELHLSASTSRVGATPVRRVDSKKLHMVPLHKKYKLTNELRALHEGEGRVLQFHDLNHSHEGIGLVIWKDALHNSIHIVLLYIVSSNQVFKHLMCCLQHKIWRQQLKEGFYRFIKAFIHFWCLCLTINFLIGKFETVNILASHYVLGNRDN